MLLKRVGPNLFLLLLEGVVDVRGPFVENEGAKLIFFSCWSFTKRTLDFTVVEVLMRKCNSMFGMLTSC